MAPPTTPIVPAVISDRPFSVHASILQCKTILERLRKNQKHYRHGRPLPQRVEEALIRLENTLKFCLPVCVGDSPKMYACVLDVLASMIRSHYHNLAKLYFDTDALWQLYMETVLEAMSAMLKYCEPQKADSEKAKLLPTESLRKRLTTPGAKVVTLVKNFVKSC